MGETTAIEWTHIPGYTGGTWNPWQGCTKVSPGCAHCYMYRDKIRYGQDPMVVKQSAQATFNLPLRAKEPHAFFTCSWSDFFHYAADPWRADAWEIIRRTPEHLYLILTKRPELIHDRLPEDWDGWKNVWIGVTIENEDYLWRWDELSLISAAVRFISVEPMLGPVKLYERPDWVICGGESGYGYRLINPEWALDLRNQCTRMSVPFFFKQIGGVRKIGGAWGGNELDGIRHAEFPAIEHTEGE